MAVSPLLCLMCALVVVYCYGDDGRHPSLSDTVISFADVDRTTQPLTKLTARVIDALARPVTVVRVTGTIEVDIDVFKGGTTQATSTPAALQINSLSTNGDSLRFRYSSTRIETHDLQVSEATSRTSSRVHTTSKSARPASAAASTSTATRSTTTTGRQSSSSASSTPQVEYKTSSAILLSSPLTATHRLTPHNYPYSRTSAWNVTDSQSLPQSCLHSTGVCAPSGHGSLSIGSPKSGSHLMSLRHSQGPTNFRVDAGGGHVQGGARLDVIAVVILGLSLL